MALLLDRLFSSVALSHMAVDLLNGQRAVLLAYWSVPFGLNNAALALISTIYVVIGALLQPIFGYISDRIGPRWIVVGGVLWISIFFIIAVFTPGKDALFFLLAASLGSASFHPAGTMQATDRGHTHFSGRETTATAYFFVFGQTGYFFGPIVGGPLLDRFGPPGLLPLAVVGLMVGLSAARQMRVSPHDKNIPLSETPRLINPNRIKLTFLPLVLFLVLAAFQGWVQQNMITFVPKYLLDLGQNASVYGVIAGLFMGGSAIGNALAGHLADHYGKRLITIGSFALSGLPILMISHIGWSPWLFALAPLAGALTGAPYPIIVVLAQRMVPGKMALASGLILGFLFSSGALGTWFTGYLADIWGFPFIFQMTAGLAFIAAVFSLSLIDQ